MIILHAAAVGRNCLLWAETSGEAAPLASLPASSSKSQNGEGHFNLESFSVKPLPFGASADQIITALEAIGLVPGPANFEVLAADIWLPTVDGWPLASSALIAVPPDSALPPSLEKWRVEALCLPFSRTLDIF